MAEWRSVGHAEPATLDVPLPTRLRDARPVWAAVAQMQPMPDVVVCGSDLLAQGVIIEAQAAGERIEPRVIDVGFRLIARDSA